MDELRDSLLKKASALEQSAKIIRDQVALGGNPIWMRSVDRRIGNDIVNFVGDIQRHERGGRKRDTTWAEGKSKTEKRRAQNTMGYVTSHD